VEERELFHGDTLALYTDGVTESFNAAGEEFGEDRLIDALRRPRDLSSKALLASLVDELRQFSPHEQHDDITLVVARCRGKLRAGKLAAGFLRRCVCLPSSLHRSK
jgi:serine phosphatase RsbU (regulator of sigma subunit)